MPANCYYIILIIAHFSSILSMLSNLLPVFTYKDTTLKAVCQVLHASFIHLITNRTRFELIVSHPNVNSMDYHFICFRTKMFFVTKRGHQVKRIPGIPCKTAKQL